MSSLDVHFSSGKDDWETPDSLFQQLDSEFHFTYDVAANHQNSKCGEYYFGPDHYSPHLRDALTATWPLYGVNWMNPPYSRGLQYKFVKKCVEEQQRGCTTVALLPSRTDTKLWHQFIWDTDKHHPLKGVELRFIKGRIKFVENGQPAKHCAPFPSVIVIFRGVTL